MLVIIDLYSSGGESQPLELYPLGLINAPALMTNVILDRIFSMLRIHQLKKCRLVCKKWNELACPLLSNKTEIFFGKIDSRGVRRAAYQSDHKYALKDASEFVDFMGKRDPNIGMTFSNIRIIPSYLPNLIGDLLLHPQIRNGIKCLEIEVYPPQLEWLKTCIQGMKNLRELTVDLFLSVPTRDHPEIVHASPSPLSNIPKKLLDCRGTLPPSLRIPDEYLASFKDSDAGNDLVLEKLTVRDGYCWHGRILVPDEAQDFLVNCLQGYDNSLRNWILQRSPHLKYIHCQYRCHLNFIETLGRISREYKGKGLKGFRIERSGCYDTHRPWMNEDWDKIFREFLKTYCLNTLEILDITYSLEKDGRIFFRFPDLPFACLKTLVITPPTSTQYYKDADFKWVPYYYKKRRGKHRPGDLEGYFLTEKLGQEELTDIFNIFHQNHSLNVLENLEFTTDIQLRYRRRSHWFRNINKHNLKQPILYAQTTRSFPRVKNLVVNFTVEESGIDFHWPRSKKFNVVVDYISLLKNAFPALTQFRITNMDTSLMNPLLLKLPANIKILQIYQPTSNSNRPLSDRVLLGNKALVRLSELRELGFYYCLRCKFTNNIIYNGFLKLPHLEVLRFSDIFRQNDPDTSINFSSEGLLALKRKLDVLEYSEFHVLQKWPLNSDATISRR